MVIVFHLVFLFALGACVGSFLNVVVWRLPRGESLVLPPSHCPKCGHHLAWYDNIPILGWVFLSGRCRYCKEKISPRYPIVELITALIFAGCYLLLFVAQIGPVAAKNTFVPSPTGGVMLEPLNPVAHWPLLLLYLVILSCLLAASLIDLELFVIPLEIPYFLALAAFIIHGVFDSPKMPGALNVSAGIGLLALGGFAGLVLSVVLWSVKVLRTSFPQGEPLLEVDREELAREIERARSAGESIPALPPEYTPTQIRQEMSWEMLFLVPPLLLAAIAFLLYLHDPGVHAWAERVMAHSWLSGLLGSLLGAMVGGLTVWLTRIVGTMAFGRVAMGLGDVHLMFGVGAAIGAAQSIVAFFIAPFFGLLIAMYFLFTRRGRELPYGPYLSLGAVTAMFFYSDILRFIGM